MIYNKFINKFNSIKSNKKKQRKIRKLLNFTRRNEKEVIILNKIWKIKENPNWKIKNSYLPNYSIFGSKIDLNIINWHKDYINGFEYPVKLFDKIKISEWFDEGIDVKFPWEVSRFYFAIKLAQNYAISKDEKYYQKFKELVIDWIDKNPFCFGINWICTMEIAIRAINWIVAVNILGDIFEKDEEFQMIFDRSLFHHAEYISNFPEIGKNAHTWNHTTADYTGLFFLSLTLKDYNKSAKWLNQAVNGLEECLRYQVYDDGVNFEASIPYHRLVLEMFAYSAIMAKIHNIEFSKEYYTLLFKMFEYSAAYMDQNGNAPQLGDNDSGRILKIDHCTENDHSYLLDLGEHIYNYMFKSQCEKRNSEFKSWLPVIDKLNISILNFKPRQTDKSIYFKQAGVYLLKNNLFSILVNFSKLGINGLGGHNHYDIGSLILSFWGKQLIVDSGTYCYTSSYYKRNQFRNRCAHNCVLFSEKYPKNLSEPAFTRPIRYNYSIESYEKSGISFYIFHKGNIVKQYLYLDKNSFTITFNSRNQFYFTLIINPQIAIKLIQSKIIFNNLKEIQILLDCDKVFLRDSQISNSYLTQEKTNKIIIINPKEIKFLVQN